MRIQNINPIYFQNTNLQKTPAKQDKIAFKSSPAVQQSMKKFIPEAGFFMFNTPNLSKANIEAFLRKFKPQINVRLFSYEESLREKYQARAEIEMGMDFCLNPKIRNTTMALCLHNCNSFEDRVRLFEDVVHEMTHIYQAEDKCDSNSQNFSINYIKEQVMKNPSEQVFNEAHKTVENALKLYSEVEHNMHEVLARGGYMYLNNIPKPIREANPLDLESTFFRLTGRTSIDYMRDLVTNGMKKYNIKDTAFIEKLFRAHSANEAEAHTTGLNAVKHIMGIVGDADRDFVPMLYKRMSQFKL